jgi:GntR family transcriptional repressor for pyruvate dehydrogenase complex
MGSPCLDPLLAPRMLAKWFRAINPGRQGLAFHRPTKGLMPDTVTIERTANRAPKLPKAAVLVAAQLRRQIVNGKVKPGDKLHPESVLQSEFAISRPTMREALRLLEAESLITIKRGKHGGARVISIDLGAIASQVGVFLQIEGTTLEDVWLARTVLEPPAAGLLAATRNPAALAALETNIAAARQAARSDLIRYADLAAEFSMLITRHCGNKTIHLLASLIYDIIRRQHENVTERTLADASVDKLRQDSLRDREKAVALMRSGTPAAAESFWRAHLEHMRDLVLQAYKSPMTIDVLSEPVGKQRPVHRIKRPARP